MTVNWTAVAISVSICSMVAIFEGFLTGDSLTTWYPGLRKPDWHIPLWAFVIVGVLVYVINGFVAYRVLTEVPSREDQLVALTALVVVMVLNTLWNYAFLEYQSTLIGFLGVVGFLGPLLVLQTALFAYDTVAAWTYIAYTLWVIAYDLPLFYVMWRLNPER